MVADADDLVGALGGLPVDAVATGRENYYTGAVAAGEPPGRWYGAGAEALGLTGLVDAQDMTRAVRAVPRPARRAFRDPERWDEVATLGHTGPQVPDRGGDVQRSLDAEPYADAERREELRWTRARLNARTSRSST